MKIQILDRNSRRLVEEFGRIGRTIDLIQKLLKIGAKTANPLPSDAPGSSQKLILDLEK